MHVALLSDAHGNHAALEQAVSWLRPRADAWCFAGDAFSDHHFSPDVVALLRDLDAVYVLGNHELSLLGPSGARARAAIDRTDLLAWVAERPTRAEVTLGGRRVLMVHASPWQPFDEYLVPGHRRLSQASELGVDVLVLGHAHQPYALTVGSTLVVNPGSVGRTDAPELADRCTFALLDTADLVVAHYAFVVGGEVTALAPR